MKLSKALATLSHFDLNDNLCMEGCSGKMKTNYTNMITRRKMLFAFMLISSLSACSKKTETSDLGELDGKVRVAFTVSGFEQELVPFPKPQSASAEKGFRAETSNSSTTELRDHINVLDIYVLHANTNEPIHHVTQYADDANFGKYENYFDPDVYTSSLYFLFAGAKLDEGDAFEWINLQRANTAGVRITPEMKDIFLTTTNMTLKNPNEDDLTLKRAVGRLDLQLQEIIPDIAGHIEVTIENTGKYLDRYGRGFTETTGAGDPVYNTVKRINILPEQLGESSLDASMYFIAKDAKEQGSVGVKVAAYDAAGVLIREVALQNVPVQRNRVTKITGQVFTAPNMTHELGIEGEWGEDFPIYEF